MMKAKQIEAKRIGASGCYLLSIIYLAEKWLRQFKKDFTADVLTLYETFVEEKWITEDCYIDRPDLCLAYIIGVDIAVLRDAFTREAAISAVKITKTGTGYVPLANELEITRYERKDTCVTYSHFVATADGKVIYDPYGSSATVTNGEPVSKRIFTINFKVTA